MKILIGDFSEEQLESLRGVAPHVDFVSPGNREELLSEIEDADALLGHKINPELVCQGKKLRWIQTGGVGVEGLMFPELVNSEIVLANGRGTAAIPIAEHVMALLLAFSRTVNMTIKYQTEKVWSKTMNLPLLEIAGDTLGLLGLGNIGLQVAKRASAFDMRILAVDPTQTEKPDYVESLWKPDRLHEMLRQSDFVAICCPPDTGDSRHDAGT